MRQMFIEVLIDQSLSKRLDYTVPENLISKLTVGSRVEVPLKNIQKKATVVALKTESSCKTVRPISRVLEEPGGLSEEQWKLAQWMARYYATPLQKVLKCFTPPNLRKAVQAKTQIFISLKQTHAFCLQLCETLRTESPEESLVLEALLQSKKGCFAADLIKELQISASPIQRLIKKKIVFSEKIPISKDFLLEEEFFPTQPKRLNQEQTECLEQITQSLNSNTFSTHLIHGVTGSGKTEVYLQAIRSALEKNKAAILLVPEISLTSQTIERFRSRFSEKIAILHHKRSMGERTMAWSQLERGEIRILVGARSAVFAPVKNLGIIIVDEEHDASYKQSEEPPFYHARNLAVMRGYLEKAVVVLGSATPSIESRYNAEIGKYRFHTISSRATAAPLPKVTLVDMKQAMDRNGGFTHFSEPLLNGIKARLDSGEQTVLFLNRRGYHRLQICGSCRTVVKCPHCDLGLTFHRNENILQCHLCGHRTAAHRQCKHCNSSETLQFKGFGTEHAERSLHAIFPSIRTLRMDRDTTQKKDSHEEIFKQFRAHKADVLIGTQMVAKGFHFPSVTLVGVLNADAALSIPDFRASENAFQLLTQVAGRSGRSELPGEVIFQTFLPDHPVLHLAAAQDYNSFYKQELEERRLFGFPPFSHLVKCLFLSKDLQQAEKAAFEAYEHTVRHLPQGAQVLAPGPSGHPKVKDEYRFQFLIRSLKIEPLIPLLESLPKTEAHRKIDIDPLSTFF